MRTITLPDRFTLSPKQVAELLDINYRTVLSYFALPEGHKLKLQAADLGTGEQNTYRISIAEFCDFCSRNNISYHLAA